MAALSGVSVLVTRPDRQATPLCLLLEAAGATAIRLPAVSISAVGELPALAAGLGPIEAFDLVIFTSANAVHFGAALLGPPRDRALAAIGPATSRALSARGHAVTVVPADGYDSEQLLRHPALQSPAGRRILIVKGREGRQLLQQRLGQLGAHVTVAEVYERVKASYSHERLTALDSTLAAGGIDVVTVTSAEIATALLDLATPSIRRRLDDVQWLVPGRRVADAARARGVRAAFIHAHSAEDHDLVTALKRWRSSVSDA